MQVLRYHGQPGDHAPGWPADHITDDWLHAKATAEGRPVADVLAEALAFRATGGGPLYTETARGTRAFGAVDPSTVPQDDELTGADDAPPPAPRRRRG